MKSTERKARKARKANGGGYGRDEAAIEESWMKKGRNGAHGAHDDLTQKADSDKTV